LIQSARRPFTGAPLIVSANALQAARLKRICVCAISGRDKDNRNG
jgi:hypothetical protein